MQQGEPKENETPDEQIEEWPEVTVERNPAEKDTEVHQKLHAAKQRFDHLHLNTYTPSDQQQPQEKHITWTEIEVCVCEKASDKESRRTQRLSGRLLFIKPFIGTTLLKNRSRQSIS